MEDKREERPERTSPSWTEYLIVAVIMGALGLLAVPRPAEGEPELDGRAAAQRLASALEETRAAVVAYRRDHGLFPGFAPGVPGLRVHGQASEPVLRAQLEGWSDVWGNASRTWMGRYSLGPYLPAGIPENPLNGLDSIRVLAAGEALPNAADGRSGWIYCPKNGELRANSLGVAAGSGGERYFDL